MGLGDCSECWETNCVCGHKYENYTKEALQNQVASLVAKKTKKEALQILKAAILITENRNE